MQEHERYFVIVIIIIIVIIITVIESDSIGEAQVRLACVTWRFWLLIVIKASEGRKTAWPLILARFAREFRGRPA